ncbi:zinc-binding dehydrogenase [Spiractinospora alimapuensis]|uniref:quinone oxidoreductase family protein n=1 Tax=Spiractinospora alimapuensis TaxID=2820884 RepID=UPI001F31CE34|nr:zinc-binding dehydrogenase [Spiractinospora alimapuensis]QVQ53152.1 zinc-binding dehydrogenase [Spiractinospora alimapuensis]
MRHTRRSARVTRFGAPETTLSNEPTNPRRIGHRARIRVTHASVGVTDVLARDGRYLLKPRTGFVPGYDFVGVLEELAPGASPNGLSPGQRVAGVLPRMGAHATEVRVNPALLAAVPDGLDSEVAATLPLDALTAYHALDQGPAGATQVLVQGAGGAVGSLAVQLARERGLAVFGTASARTGHTAESHGARVFDYRDPAWLDALSAELDGGVDLAIDHTGGTRVRRVVARHGRVVRTAFGDASALPRATTALRSLGTVARHLARPTERICSVPLWAMARPSEVGRTLDALLERCAHGRLSPPSPRVVPFTAYDEAVGLTRDQAPGTKVVLRMPPG